MDKTVEDVYLDYIKFLSLKCKDTTVLATKRKFKNYILPYFGEMALHEIDESKYINFQLEIGKLNYSAMFYKQITSTLKKFYSYLGLLYNITNIPGKIGNLNSGKTNHIVKTVWSKKQFKKFIRVIHDRIYHAFFNTLFYTGIRKGEALALQVKDFDGKSLNISKTITKELFDGKRKLTEPKSQSSNMEVRLDFLLRIELKLLIRYYNKFFDNFNREFFLFGGEEPIAATTLDRKKNEYCATAGIKPIRIHDFRHSHATMLYKKHIRIKTIQERLGHADISTTMNTYVHSDDREQKKVIRTITLLRL